MVSASRLGSTPALLLLLLLLLFLFACSVAQGHSDVDDDSPVLFYGVPPPSDDDDGPPLSSAPSPAIPVKSEFDFDLHVDVSKGGKLGLQLSSDLIVLSFSPNSWAYDPGGVRSGDQLVSIDGVACLGLRLQSATKSISKARVLTFRPRESGKHREALNAHSPLQLKEAHVETIMGHMDLLEGHLDLYSVPVTVALFSSLVQKDCVPRQILLAEPPSLCVLPTPLPPDLLKRFDGATVLATRGDCSYSAKALNALSLGARTLVVSNVDNSRSVEMPIDPAYLKGRIGIPAVMIGGADGRKIEATLRANKQGSVRARLAIDAKCLKEDAAFHRKHDEGYEAERREQTKRERAAVEESASRVNAKGVRTPKGDEQAKATLPTPTQRQQRDKKGADKTKKDEARQGQGQESDPFAWQYAPSAKDVKAMFGGEIVIKDDESKVEFLAMTDVQEWLPDGAELDVVVVEREVGCKPKKKEEEKKEKRAGRQKKKAAATDSLADKYFAVIFPTGGCTVAEQIRGAEELDAAAVIIWRGTSEGGDAGSVVLRDLKGAEELTRAGSEVKGVIVSEASAQRVLEAWAATKVPGPAVLSVKVLVNNAVSDDWQDLSNLLRISEWPRDQALRQRLFLRLSKTYDERRWPDRYRVLKWTFEAAELYWREREESEVKQRELQETSKDELDCRESAQRREPFRNDEL